MDMTESRRFTRTLWPQIEQDVAAAIDIVSRVDNSDGHFDMRVIFHNKLTWVVTRFPCGTPGCALGHVEHVNQNLAARLEEPAAMWNELFHSKLAATIHAPADWCAHATQWLRARGYEYSQV